MEYRIFRKRIFIKTGSRMVGVRLADIVTLEGSNHYVKITTAGNKYHLSRSTLKEMEEQLEALPDMDFCRVSRSSIVNLDFVDEVNGKVIQMGASKVDVDPSYYGMFCQRLLMA